MTRTLLMVVAVVLVGGLAAAAAADTPETKRKVRELTSGVSGSKEYRGVVEKIDENEMTLVEVEDGKEPVEHRFVPVDILRQGETMTEVFSSYTYRWSDVKRGDTIRVETREDAEEKVVYCLMINIKRRPGGKLPKSQQPKQDADRYATDTVLNDIENGEDVSDADIKKAFPPREAIHHHERLVRPALPGGLSEEWQEKLDAIRAKKAKEKDLKATPPEKPADKK